MRYIFPLLILSLFAVTCQKKVDGTNEDVIVRVGNKSLSKSELEKNISKGLSTEDSMVLAEKFVRLWIKDNLLYDIAVKNLGDREEIKQLVENYRRSLIIYQYQEQLINEKLSKEIGETEMKQYYQEYSDKFVLDKTLIKGLFLKIPVEAPQIDEVRKWYKSSTQASLGNIEKYSVQNAAIYDYFYDKWVDFNELLENMPIPQVNHTVVIKNNKNIELQDSSYYYFLHIEDFLLPGDNAPFEYAQSTIKELLMNRRRMEFLRRIEDDLYNSALNKGQIQYYNE